MDKKHIRNSILNKMHNMSLEVRDKKNKNIFDKIISDKNIINANDIMCFVSFKDEVNTHELIKYLLEINKNIYIPVIDDKNKVMNISRINSFNELEESFYNILEPKKEYMRITNPEILDVVITPGVVFDKDNYRIGYGGGYYDKFFCNNNIKAVKIGICYCEQLVDKVPRNDYDIPVDYLIYS